MNPDYIGATSARIIADHADGTMAVAVGIVCIVLQPSQVDRTGRCMVFELRRHAAQWRVDAFWGFER
ncbi:hypothetical protein [Nocardia salmonicida]|uniref:hypothetical protein n=1 Tax=Nocardia salmonicida TaxID=53431 RepID=UPI002E2DB9EC|nr:hypothetical protein [Nocardia salmonicida]